MKNFKLNAFGGVLLTTLLTLSLACCKEDDGGTIVEDPPKTYAVTINMTQEVSGEALKMNTADMPYTNVLGQKYNISKLQYLISDVTFNKTDGSSFTIEDEYFYVDLADSSTLSFTPNTKVPESAYAQSIVSILPVQILAYYLAIQRGLDPDMPRNLAKSVTVK